MTENLSSVSAPFSKKKCIRKWNIYAKSNIYRTKFAVMKLTPQHKPASTIDFR